MKKTMLMMAMVIALAMSTMAGAFASGNLLAPFTEAELENWGPDRTYPSGDVKSVSFDGRDNVAEISIVAEEQDTRGSFYYFEGIKKVGDFGDAVQVDLYVPDEWENDGPANVGFWTSDDPLSAYPLIVFRNGDNGDAGFYVFDVEFDEEGDAFGVYVDAGVPVNYGDWNTLSIMLDTDNDVASYTINGEDAGSMSIAVTGDNIGEVFLNHYNDGVNDYTAHWHAGVVAMPDADDCKNGGFDDLGFRNQGQCIASFQANANAHVGR